MSEVLARLSNELADVVEAGGQSLVRVNARRRLPASGIVWSADGMIITANHVVASDDRIKVGLPGGETVTAELLGRDPSTDIALLRVNASGLALPQWQEPSELREGHMVLALGRPADRAQATLGIVSALGSEWRTPHGGQVDHYLQTDVIMYPGFSGGPLLDAATGKIAGLNTSALSHGVSIAIPAPTLRRVAATLLEHGRVRQGFLGITAQHINLPDAVAESNEQDTALLIAGVESGSPADQAGLVLGDTLIKLDGQDITGLKALLGVLSGDRIGQPVPAVILRGGAVVELPVTIGERHEG